MPPRLPRPSAANLLAALALAQAPAGMPKTEPTTQAIPPTDVGRLVPLRCRHGCRGHPGKSSRSARAGTGTSRRAPAAMPEALHPLNTRHATRLHEAPPPQWCNRYRCAHRHHGSHRGPALRAKRLTGRSRCLDPSRPHERLHPDRIGDKGAGIPIERPQSSAGFVPKRQGAARRDRAACTTMPNTVIGDAVGSLRALPNAHSALRNRAG